MSSYYSPYHARALRFPTFFFKNLRPLCSCICKGKQRKRMNVVITLDPKLVEKAKELGLNIFRVCENALIQAVNALEGVFNGKGDGLGTIDSWLGSRAGFYT